MNQRVNFLLRFSFILTLFLQFLTPTLLSAGNIPQTLIQLLEGKHPDLETFAQNLSEKNIPIALALTDLLKFKTAHGELPYKAGQIKDYVKILQSRFQNATLISPIKSEAFPGEVPEKTLSIEGRKILVPKYFTAQTGLMLFAFKPSGDSPNPFPVISAQFQGEEGEVQVKMVVDGIEVENLTVSQGQVIYKPSFSEENVLAVGTHTVQLAIKDGKGQKTARSWSFTVGMEKHSGLDIPQDAKPSGQFTIPAKFLFPGCHPDLTVTIRLFKNDREQKLFEYLLDKSGKRRVRTSSLRLLNRVVKQLEEGDPLTISPESPYAFDGNEITASFKYSGGGTISSINWRVENLTDNYTSTEPTITWLLNWQSQVTLSIEVILGGINQTRETVYFNADHEISIFHIQTDYWDNDFMVTLDGSGTLPISAQRHFWNPDGGLPELKEGETHQISGKGKLTVNKSRWKVLKAKGEVEIEDPTLGETRLLFTTPGIAELVQEFDLVFDWDGKESFHGVPDPKESRLYGLFPYKTTFNFKKFPPGIIFKSSRNIVLEQFSIELNGERRDIDLNGKIDPPIQLALSEQFPHIPPLVAEKVHFMSKPTPILRN